MRPSRLSFSKNDLFRERLDVIINKRHPLVRLAAVIPCPRFDAAFGGFYRPLGRPAKPTRLMVGLHYLKHVHDLSDDEVVDRWVENPLLAGLLRLRVLPARGADRREHDDTLANACRA